METRICNLCGRELPLTNEYFAYRNKAEGKYRERCKECQSEYFRNRWLSIKEDDERLKKRHEVCARYYQNHKNEISERQRTLQGRRYWGDAEYAARKGCDLPTSGKQYAEPMREELLRRKKQCRQSEHSKEVIREYRKRYTNDRWHNDPRYHAIAQVRNALYKTFTRKGELKSKKNIELTGMTSRELYEYLLETFKQNYGYEWDHVEPVHIDHIIPLSTAKDKAEIEALCHYTNLQLLKAHDNWAKNDSLDYELTTPQERM